MSPSASACKDHSGTLTFNEFARYFEAKAEEAEKYHADLVAHGKTDSAQNYFVNGDLIIGTEAAVPKISEALTKFQQLDVDKSGELDQDEMNELAKWVYLTFSENGQLTPAQVTIESGKLLRKLDKDKSKGVCFAEFVDYYEKKLKQAAKFAKLKAAKAEAPPAQ